MTAMLCYESEPTGVTKTNAKWFSRKYYASVMNLKEFYEENIGATFAGLISDFARRCNNRH